MSLTILLGVILFGIINSSDTDSSSVKCVDIVSNTFGRMQCEPSKHIHIESISIDNEQCPSKPSPFSIGYSSITSLTCHGNRNCSVPFKLPPGHFNKYLKIQYTCLGCISVTNGGIINIRCKRNTIIKIQDVWMNFTTECPAYKDTHLTSYTDIHIKCNLKQTCNITNVDNQILSIYFYCEVSLFMLLCMNTSSWLTTTNRRNTSPTTTILSVNTKTIYSFISNAASLQSTHIPTVIPSNTSHPIFTGAVAGGVVTVIIIIIFLPVGVLLYRRRNNDHTKSPQKQFVTRPNPAHESDIDVGTDGYPYNNKDSSLYHHYFEVQNDQDIVTATHIYINTDNITYDYASEIGPFKEDDTKKGDMGNQQLEEVDFNTYSHLQDTFNDSDENTYNHTSHARVQNIPENDYSVSRCQMSDDDYDVSGNHYRGNLKNGSENIYN